MVCAWVVGGTSGLDHPGPEHSGVLGPKIDETLKKLKNHRHHPTMAIELADSIVKLLGVGTRVEAEGFPLPGAFMDK